MVVDFLKNIKHKNFFSKWVYLLSVKIKRKISRNFYNKPFLLIFITNILKKFFFFKKDSVDTLENLIQGTLLINQVKKIDIVNNKKLYDSFFINRFDHLSKFTFHFPKKVGVFALFNNLIFIERWCKERSIEFMPSDYNWIYDLEINKVIPNWNFQKANSITQDDVDYSYRIFDEARKELSLIYELNLEETRIEKMKLLKDKYDEYYSLIQEFDYMKNYIKIINTYEGLNIMNVNTGSKSFETIVPSLDGCVNLIKNSKEKIDLLLCEDSFFIKEISRQTGVAIWENVPDKRNMQNHFKITNKGLENVIEINTKSLILSRANKIFVDPLSNIATGPLLMTNTLKIHDEVYPYSNRIIIP
tara:strand:- start:3071 stop:4147 length:1077 start_codon:yes stop_codon:yes gene_type:complete